MFIVEKFYVNLIFDFYMSRMPGSFSTAEAAHACCMGLNQISSKQHQYYQYRVKEIEDDTEHIKPGRETPVSG